MYISHIMWPVVRVRSGEKVRGKVGGTTAFISWSAVGGETGVS